MANKRYWVIGGEYRSLDFDQIIDGTGRVIGPFSSLTHAEYAWRGAPLELQHALHHRAGRRANGRQGGGLATPSSRVLRNTQCCAANPGSLSIKLLTMRFFQSAFPSSQPLPRR
jgi:hypothetical protein